MFYDKIEVNIPPVSEHAAVVLIKDGELIELYGATNLEVVQQPYGLPSIRVTLTAKLVDANLSVYPVREQL